MTDGIIDNVMSPHNHPGLVNREVIMKRLAKAELREEISNAVSRSGLGWVRERDVF